jgi:hypothetical protein
MRVKTLVTGRTKASLVKSTKTGASKKRSRKEASDVGQSSSRPAPPNLENEWKKVKLKTKDILALVNGGFLQKKEMDLWRAATGDPYPMEKNPDEIPMSVQFVERRLALPASDVFKGLMRYYDIEYMNLNPNGIFHISVFVYFCEAFVGIKPH